MQHHGCATRLLDFTSNPLIALFFASDPSVDKDGEVITAKYGRSYENVSDENLFERKNSFAYYPPHITERIIGQSGCFVYSGKPNQPLNSKQLETISISKDNKNIIRWELQDLGISYSSLFPGMDGVCKDNNHRDNNHRHPHIKKTRTQDHGNWPGSKLSKKYNASAPAPSQ